MIMLPQAVEEAVGNAPTIQTDERFLFLNLPESWVIGLVLLPLTIAFAWWAYGGLARLEPRTRLVLATLRGLALLFCLLLIFQPAWERVRYTEVQSQVHVLVDDSASMQRRDTYPDASEREALRSASGITDLASTTRSELVARVLEKPGGLIERLRETFDVRLFRFVRKPVPISGLGELTARGNRTHIGDALDLHLANAAAVNLDSVVLVSDGRSNAGLSPVETAPKYRLNGIPIYTIGVGDPNPPRNIRLVGPPGPKEALRKEELVFECTLESEGLEGREVTVTMHGARDGEPERMLATQAVALGRDLEPQKVRLYHAFDEAGDWVLRFKVTELPEETSFEDNAATRFLHVDDQTIRVLFVDYLPRWQYRYLKNALERVDESIEYQAWLDDASRSFIQEHSEGLPPLTGIPRTREELFQYHVILLGDIPPERIAPTEEEVMEWLQLLVEFVEYGGGVAFLSGPVAMPESYRGTPLEDLLPVVLEDPADLRLALARAENEEFQVRLENPAQPHDLVLLKRDPDNNRLLWHEGFQPFAWYYPVQQVKPGAIPLLRHETAKHDRYGSRVIAATSFYPRGHTFFLATDETWRLRNPYGEKYHDAFWRNVVRHLASGRLRRRDDRLELRTDRVTVETGGQVGVRVSLLDEEFHPAQLEQFPVFLRRAETVEPDRLFLRPVTGEPGTFSGRFTFDEPGSYSFLVYADANPVGEVLAREDVFVKIPDREMAESSQDAVTLQQIAEASKDGRYVFLADADTLLEELGDRRTLDTEVDRSTRPIWDSMWSLVGLLVLLAAEWILRKRARLV